MEPEALPQQHEPLKGELESAAGGEGSADARQPDAGQSQGARQQQGQKQEAGQQKKGRQQQQQQQTKPQQQQQQQQQQQSSGGNQRGAGGPAPGAVAPLASRRPGWELPALHADLQLASLEPLQGGKGRAQCPKCGRSRAHYCYDCLVALTPGVPHVQLPFRVSIVTHHEEKASKNTGVQVAILAQGQVDLHSMTSVPTDVDPSRCAVLFPSDTALEVSELEPDSIDRLFIIDSRWKKAGELVQSEVFRKMRAVKLKETRSAFWRFHTKGVSDEGVCTVEALYFFLDALAKQGKLTDARFAAPHAFDNLLYYFVHQHQVVQQAAQKRLQAHGGTHGQEVEEVAPVGAGGEAAAAASGAQAEAAAGGTTDDVAEGGPCKKAKR